MPARAATPIRALTLLRRGIPWIRPAKVAGAASEAWGVTATALSMDRAIRPGRQATGQQRLFGTPPGRMRETGRHCGASSRQRRAAASLRCRQGSKPAMNVTLKPFDFAQAVARAGLGTDGVPLGKGPAAAPEVGFQKALSQALGAVSKSQNDATAMQREVTLDNPTVSLE